MSSYYEKGRADKAAGKDTPPHGGFGDAIASNFGNNAERQDKDIAEWREGYHDKKREIEEED